jgi:RNA polymerase sigma-70 factor (ECF subfamily)
LLQIIRRRFSVPLITPSNNTTTHDAGRFEFRRGRTHAAAATTAAATRHTGHGGVDRDTFDRLMLQHLSAALRFATRLTGDPSTAEDLVHDAIVRAAGGWSAFRGESSFTTWLFRIVVNVFRDRIDANARRRRTTNGGAFDEDGEIRDGGIGGAAVPDPSAAAQSRELGELIARHISSLPPRQREVLVLVAYEGMTPAQTAAVLAISEQNARTNLHHARQRLKQSLASYLGDAHSA